MRLAHIHFPNITPFSRVSHLQQTLAARLLAYKKASSPPATSTATSQDSTTTPTPPDPTIITFSPNPVYTTGRRDLPPSNTYPEKEDGPLSLPPPLEPIRSLLTSAKDGSAPIAEYHPTLRGGQTTYHGPGQLVGYTVLDLRRMGLTPRCHIRLLENSVIDVLDGFGVKGFTTEDPGVWVSDGGNALPKKITAVGVHLRRNISSYGIGLNVTEEPMWFFKQIVACGLEGREATSLEGLGVRDVTMEDVARRFVAAFVNRHNNDYCGTGSHGEKIEEVYTVREDELLD
ncbi:hypothetical protein DTO282E5_2765 [Paecilomyces variotii]|nr:hypothetical protein DTO027B9_5978 [Paecilomyces variotii]KAJ9372438.1 hypothetical protein DTO282E5_2765 [Paecilomyces variotii]